MFITYGGARTLHPVLQALCKHYRTMDKVFVFLAVYIFNVMWNLLSLFRTSTPHSITLQCPTKVHKNSRSSSLKATSVDLVDLQILIYYFYLNPEKYDHLERQNTESKTGDDFFFMERNQLEKTNTIPCCFVF